MAEIDPELSLSSQLRKIRFDQLANASATLAQNFTKAGTLSKNMAIQMAANLAAMRQQNNSIRLQIRADQEELRLKRQRQGIINQEIREISARLSRARTEATNIFTRGRFPAGTPGGVGGRFAGAEALVQRLDLIADLEPKLKKLLGRQKSIGADIDGLTTGINSKQFGMKILKFEFIAQAAQTVASALTDASNALSEFTQKIYAVQQRLAVGMGTATQLQIAAIRSSIASYFSFDKPILSSEEIIAAQEAFKREFGTILAPEEQERIASESNRLGITADVYTRARRAFLGTGSAEASRMAAMNEFAKQGLSAGAALQFAADNATLVAIAGEKYADSLFRAAAESKKIGINLADVEKFANSIVGDFEATVTNFAELSALGVDLDMVKIAATAQFGTPEDMQNVLQEQLSLSGITGEELQRNRTLRLALTQTTGMDEATILRLAGVAQAPTEQTIQEKQYDTLSKMLEVLTKIAKGFSIIGQILATAVGGAVSGAGIGFLFGGPAGSALGAAIGGGVGLIGGILSAAGGMIGMRAGGLVRGPGTGTSDSVPAMLSNGEYVIPAKTTEALGVETLDRIRMFGGYGNYALSGAEFAYAASQPDAFNVSDAAKLRRSIGLRQVNTIFGNISKRSNGLNLFGKQLLSPVALKMLGTNLKLVPIVGAILGGILESFVEYGETKNLSRAFGKGIFSAGGGILGSIGGSIITGGTPIGAAVGGIAGSELAEELFDVLFPQEYGRKMKDGGLVQSKKYPKGLSPQAEQMMQKMIRISGGGRPDITTENPYAWVFKLPPVLRSLATMAIEARARIGGQKDPTGIVTGERSMYDGDFNDEIYFSPRHMEVLRNKKYFKAPESLYTYQTLFHEMMHRRDNLVGPLPEGALLYPEPLRTQVRNSLPTKKNPNPKRVYIPAIPIRRGDKPDSLALDAYGQSNKSEAYAQTGESVIRFLEYYSKAKEGSLNTKNKQATVLLPYERGNELQYYSADRNQILNIIANHEIQNPGFGTLLLQLLDEPDYLKNPLRKLIYGLRPRQTTNSLITPITPITKKHSGGFVNGSGEVPAMLKGGEYVVNPKATSMYGTEFLGNINTGTYTQPAPVVNNNVTVNNDALRGELRQLVSSIRDMRIEMNGYDVGHVALNESRTPLRTL